jgi:hypothetical protein
VVVTSEEEEKNCCVDEPLIAYRCLSTGTMFMVPSEAEKAINISQSHECGV